MTWNYADQIGTLTLSDVCTAAVIEDEYGSGLTDPGYRIAGRDGLVFDPQAPWTARTFVLKTVLRYTDSAGAVVHADGAAGHVYENLTLIRNQFGSGREVFYVRTVPHAGQIRAAVKLLDSPIADGSQRHVVRWPLTIPTGSWQDNTESSAAAASVVTSGDRRIPDPIIEFAAAGTLTHTAADGTVSTITINTGPTFPVTVDVGARTVTDNTAADVRGSADFDQQWWLRMDPDGAQTFTGSATVRWRNRWAF